jgi:hypothetical protein
MKRRRPANFPGQLHDDTDADHSLAAAHDGDYTRLRQRILERIASQQELELNDSILAELQATRRVKTPRAKILDGRSNDNIALMVLEVEAAMRRYWPDVPQGFRDRACRYVERIFCGRRKYQSIKNATIKFERDQEKMAFANKLIPELLGLDPPLWDPDRFRDDRFI